MVPTAGNHLRQGFPRRIHPQRALPRLPRLHPFPANRKRRRMAGGRLTPFLAVLFSQQEPPDETRGPRLPPPRCGGGQLVFSITTPRGSTVFDGAHWSGPYSATGIRLLLTASSDPLNTTVRPRKWTCQVRATLRSTGIRKTSCNMQTT